MATTYAALKTTLTDWAQNSAFTTANIEECVRLAQDYLNTGLRIYPLITTANVTIAATGSTGATPSDFVEAISAHIGTTALPYVSPKEIDRITGGTVPWAYTVRGALLHVAPSWTAGGTVVLKYYKREPALVTTTQETNWYTNNAEDLLLETSMLFIRKKERENAEEYKIYKTLLDEKLKNLNEVYA